MNKIDRKAPLENLAVIVQQYNNKQIDVVVLINEVEKVWEEMGKLSKEEKAEMLEVMSKIKDINSLRDMLFLTGKVTSHD